MICPKCGAQIPDDAKFCGACGNAIAAGEINQVPSQQSITESVPVENPAPEPTDTASETPSDNFDGTTNYSYQQQTQNNNNFQGNYPQPSQNNGGYNYNAQQPNPAASNKLPFIILGGIVVVAVVVIIIIFNLIFGSSYKTPIKDTVKFLNNQSTDVKKYLQLSSGKTYGNYQYELAKLTAKIEDEDNWEDDIVDTIEDMYDMFEDEYGDDWEITYEIKRATQIRESKLDDYQDDWEDKAKDIEDMIDYLEYSDYSDDDIEELTDFYEDWSKKIGDMEVEDGYTVKLKITIKGDDEKDTNTEEVTVLKIDDEWICIDFLF